MIITKSRVMSSSEVSKPVSPWQPPHDVKKRIIEILRTPKGE